MGTWIAEANIRGPVLLVGQVSVHSCHAPHPCIKKVELEPRNDRQEALSLKCWIQVDGDDADVPAWQVWAVASDCLNRVAGLLAITVWDPLKVRLRSIVTQSCIGPNGEKRMILLAENAKDIRPPSAISCEVLLRATDEHVLRAVLWTRKAMAEEDPYDRFLGLVIACTLIASHLEGARGRRRECRKCGHVDLLEPGDHEYFQNLCAVVGEDADVAERIWKVRCQLVHGGVAATSETRFEVLSMAAKLEYVLQEAITRILGEGIVLRPSGPRFDLDAGLLDLRLVEKGEHQ